MSARRPRDTVRHGRQGDAADTVTAGVTRGLTKSGRPTPPPSARGVGVSAHDRETIRGRSDLVLTLQSEERARKPAADPRRREAASGLRKGRSLQLASKPERVPASARM